MTGWATAILMLVGSVFTLLAATGVLKLPDAVMRMQASAKASTLGLACLLLGAAFQLPDLSSVVRLMSLGGFLMATAPLSAHIVARATLSRGAPLWEGLVVNEHPPSNGRNGEGQRRDMASSTRADAADTGR